MEERLNGPLTMSKDMNPTRMVTMGIVAFAVIGVLALGANESSSTAADDAAASAPAPTAPAPAPAPQPAAVKAAPANSDEFNAWLDNPDEGEAAPEPDDVVDEADESAPAPAPPASHSDNSNNKNRPIGSDYE
jgi:hypothetical protein